MAWISPTSAQCPEEWMTDQRAYLKFTVTSISDSDAATNKRYIGWKVTIEGTPWVALYGAYAVLGGKEIVPYDTSINVRNWNSGQIFASNTTTFDNDSSGNLTLGLYLKQLFYYDDWAWNQYSQDTSATFTCSQLPRYANFTSHTATSEINKITVTYTADANYKAQQYKLNDGEWTDTTAGNYTLTGLTPNTTYTIKTKIQRTDSDLWKESDAITITTKSLPNSISPADIDFNGTNGNTITPSLSSIDYINEWYVIVKDGTTQVRSFSGNVATTISKDYTLTASDFTGMLPRHTNTDNWNLTIVYKVKSNGTTYTLTDRTCKVTIPSNQYLPVYNTNNISYAVTDSLTLSLNNNNKTKVIKGISNVRVTSTAASPQGSATMASYIASSGTKSKSGTTTTAPIVIDLEAVDGSSVSVQAIDSRNKSTIATKDYAAMIDYFAPVVDSSTIVRVDGIGTNLSVNISGRYCNWSGLATSNTIEQVSIQYRIKGTTSWTTKTGITFTRNVGNGNFNITGNITGNNFVATNEYELLLTFKDKVNNFEILANIPTGASFLWRDLSNKRLGVNKKPSQALDVNGNIACSNMYGNTFPNYFTDAQYNTSGSVNLYDRHYVDSISANRSAFFPGENVYIEHSTDGGSTWTEYPISSMNALSRKNIFSMTRASSITLATVTPITTSHQCRITLQYPGASWYCSLDRIFMFLNTSGHTLVCDIEVSTYGAQTTYTKIRTNNPISGWSGPNMISFGNRSAWGNNSNAHVYNIRLTIKITAVRSGSESNKPSISDIRFYGPNYWGTANTPRYNGHIYSWDANMNVNFPGDIKSNGTNIILKAYPIGSIYMSVNDTNPGTLFGGTWEQITGDAYLKIVTSDAGTLGGTSSEHKIPVSSMPSHRHLESHVAGPRGGGGSQYDWNTMLTNGANNTSGWNNYSAYEGGGNAYYPYYFGVYVWKRTA